MKRRLLSLLNRLGLLLPTYRAYEALRAVRGRGGSAQDGLPLPPARLRLMVAGVSEYAAEVRALRFPSDEHTYRIEPEELEGLRRYLDQESLATSAWDW